MEGDAATADRLREIIQAVVTDLLGKTAIPAVAAQSQLLDEVAGDDWWADITLPMLELVRLRVRDLAGFVTSTDARSPIYTDFQDMLTEAVDVDLPGTTPGLNWERFIAKTTAHLLAHNKDVAVQKLRRNRQLTSQDLESLERLLRECGAQTSHLTRARMDAGGLGLFVRSLVGLDRAAAMEAFATFLDESRFNVEQIRFVERVITELTANGVMEPSRLFESPYTDDLPQGPDMIFPSQDMVVLVDILRRVKEHAVA